MSSISDAFLDGTFEVFDTMFSDKVYISFLDTAETIGNIYNEAKEKIYSEPIALVAKFMLVTASEGTNISKPRHYAEVLVPTKSLLLNDISIDPADVDILTNAKITYDGIDYPVLEVLPTTNINDVYIFHKFSCDFPNAREVTV